MRLALVVLAACGSTQPHPVASDPNLHTPGQLAEDDEVKPSYGKPELEKALIAERGAEATAERQVSDLEASGTEDQLRTAVADLAIRRRFIATLELCQASGHACPPRLDDPPWKFDIAADGSRAPVDAPLRFELADWQKLAAELHGRACACRTLACVDSLGVAINELEQRPMMDVRGDETASASITRARECLFQLRGKTIAKHTIAPVETE